MIDDVFSLDFSCILSVFHMYFLYIPPVFGYYLPSISSVRSLFSAIFVFLVFPQSSPCFLLRFQWRIFSALQFSTYIASFSPAFKKKIYLKKKKQFRPIFTHNDPCGHMSRPGRPLDWLQLCLNELNPCDPQKW